MDPVDDGQAAVDAATAMIAATTAADLVRPTPCADWDVRALIAHMVWMCDVFDAGLSDGDETPPAAPGDLAGGDPADIYARAASRTMARWRAGGWQDKTLALPFGTLPAVVGVRVFVGDQLIHTWDLATAIGQEFVMPSDTAAIQLDMMERYYDPETRGPDRPFDTASDCPEDASVQDRLIALSGRRLRS